MKKKSINLIRIDKVIGYNYFNFMKKIFTIYVILVSICFSENNLKRSILPIVKITNYTDENGLKYKIPTGTAILIKDSIKYPNRLFLITAKHVIEKDSATDCMFNFSKKYDKRKDIVCSVKKYTIYKNEWKFHPDDKVNLTSYDTTFYTYDIAIAEIFLTRIQIDDEVLWNEALDINNFSTKKLDEIDSLKILAFPFVNKFNWERGLTLGDIEQDIGIKRINNQNIIKFEKNKNVINLNEIYIENPKFRPGYSGGLVYYEQNNKITIAGVSMGMTNIIKRRNNSFCLSFYIKAENIKYCLYNNFK